MNHLILVRHGESRWNLSNKFTGWTDVPLSKNGVKEALQAAEILKKYKFDCAFVSGLTRAKSTLDIILSAQEKTGVFIHKGRDNNKWQINSNRLNDNDIAVTTNEIFNERYYGNIQGMNKDHAREKFGEEKVFQWRRTFDGVPPMGESLNDVYHRAVPYFKKKVMPQVRKGKNVIVSAHGNTLRTLLKYLLKIDDEKIAMLELPTCMPLEFEYDKRKLRYIGKEITYDRPLFWNN